ncbi:MAG TPA: GDSL-type esterase/lipase family protein, partial [Polyangiaceae bacterium]
MHRTRLYSIALITLTSLVSCGNEGGSGPALRSAGGASVEGTVRAQGGLFGAQGGSLVAQGGSVAPQGGTLSMPATGGAIGGASGKASGGSSSLGGAAAGGATARGGNNAGGGAGRGGHESASGGGASTFGGGSNLGGASTGGSTPSTGGALTVGGAANVAGSFVTGGRASNGSNTSGGTRSSGGQSSLGGSSGTSGSTGTPRPCPTDGTPCKIMPFGDSITDGYNADTPGGYRVELFRLAHSAGKNVTFVGENYNGPDTVGGAAFPHNHQGHSGWSIYPYSGRSGISTKVATVMPKFTPHIILLMIGTNDAIDDHDMANAPTRLGTLIDSIYVQLPNVFVVVAQPIPSRGDSSKGDDTALSARLK